MRNIRTKYLLRMTLFILVTIGGLILFYNLFAEDFYISENKKAMNELYSKIGTMNLSELKDKEIDLLDEYSEQGFQLMVIGGKKVVYSTYNRAEDRKAVRRTIVNDIDRYEKDAIATRSESGNSINLRGMVVQDDTKYCVYITIKLRTLSSSIDFMSNFLVMGLIIILAISIPFSFYMANKTIKPIEEIGKMTKRMEQNKYTEKEVYYFENDEIGELADNIKEMYSKITNSVNEMNNYNYLLQMQNRNLIKFEERRTEFINKATHELKTPLAIVSSQVEMLNLDNSEIMSEYYDSIMEEIQKMSDLIRDMLKTSFDDKPVEVEKLEEADLSQLINSLQGKYSVWMDTKNINSLFEVEQDVRIRMNPQLIEQAINNYIINAYEHTEENGCIKLSLKKQDNKAVISVYNDGKNIQDNELKNIWNKFKSGKTDNNSSNAGLGLYIVNDIVKYHNGSCYVANRQSGVEFYMEFDLV